MLKQLEGIRVLESATLFNGDHVGTLLGDLGADVIKIESPFQGDYLRDFAVGAAVAEAADLAEHDVRLALALLRVIDVAGADACVASAWISATYQLNDARIADRKTMPAPGQSDLASAKYQFYETADRKFVLFCAIEHKFWDHFCQAVGRPDLAARKNASAPVDFAAGEVELRHELQRIFRTRTLEEWMKVAVEQDVAMGPAPTRLPELLDDPHMRQRQIFYEAEHPQAGPFTYVGQPAVIEGQDYEVWRPAPGLGEHTTEVLTELDLTADQLDQLASEHVI